MANVKITELTAATALAGTDVLPIVDVGADATKKVSVSDLLRNLPDGTASAPALAFADDQNTGVLSPGDNSLAFATSGTQRLVIDSSGKVGIGVASPARELSIGDGSGSPNIQLLASSSGNSRIEFGDSDDSDAGEIQYVHSSNYMQFTTNGSERLRIDSSGDLSVPRAASGYMFQTGNSIRAGIRSNDQNELIFKRGTDATGMVLASTGLGIGTTSPAALLHLESSSPIIQLEDTDASGAYSQINGNGTGGRLVLSADAGNTGTNSTLEFHVDGGERARIDSSGRLGIGTTSPTSALTVAQTGHSSVEIRSNRTGAADNIGAIQFRTVSTDVAYIQSLVDGTLKFRNTSALTERMRIDSSGRVLIGGTNTYKDDADNLVVQGTGNVGVTIASTSTGKSNLYFADSTSNPGAYACYFEYDHNADDLKIGQGNNERLRINSSGNVGIGDTSPTKPLTVGTSTPVVLLDDQSSRTLELRGPSSTHVAGLLTTSNHSLLLGTNNTERMRLDASGRLLVNTTSSFNDGSTIQLAGSDSHLGLKYTGTTGGNETQIRWFDKRNQANAVIANNLTDDGTGTQAAHLVFKTANAGTLSERMRITENGNLTIGTTSTTRTQANRSMVFTVGTNGDISINHSTSNGSGDPYLTFGYNGSAIGSVTQSGTTAVLYNTTSDYRLKENVVDLDGGITRVKQLQPRRFNFIADADTTVDGFVAHEAQAVVPEAVTGTHNEVDSDNNPVYQGIDQSKLVPLLTAALQEAIAKIETLETKVAALEAQ